MTLQKREWSGNDNIRLILTDNKVQPYSTLDYFQAKGPRPSVGA